MGRNFLKGLTLPNGRLKKPIGLKETGGFERNLGETQKWPLSPFKKGLRN